MYITLLISSLLFILTVIYILRRERLAFYHPLFLFLLWHFLGYVYVPWHILIGGDWNYLLRLGTHLDNNYFLIKTLVLVNLGFLSVVLGYFSRYGLRYAASIKMPPVIIINRVALVTGFIIIALAVYSIMNYHAIPLIHKKVIAYYEVGESGGAIFTKASGYIVLSVNFLLGVGLTWYYVSINNNRAWRLLAWSLIIGYLIFSMLRGWHRAGWVLLLVGLVSLELIRRDRQWPALKYVACAIPLFIIFNISGADRRAWKIMIEEGRPSQEYIEKGVDRIGGEGIKNDISNYEYNTLQVLHYHQGVPFEFGRTYFNSWLVAALPRVVFKNKDSYMLPLNISKVRDPAFRYTIGSCTGIYIEFYQNFGVPGVIVGGFLFGMALHMLWLIFQNCVSTEVSHKYFVLLYAGIIAYLPQLMRDGLITLFSGYFFVLAPIIVTLLLSRKYVQMLGLKLVCQEYLYQGNRGKHRGRSRGFRVSGEEGGKW